MKDGNDKRDKVGLKEITFAADVSVATASRVLSGNNRVAPDIQRVVFEEATKLGTPQRLEARTFRDHPWWNEDAESYPAICAS